MQRICDQRLNAERRICKVGLRVFLFVKNNFLTAAYWWQNRQHIPFSKLRLQSTQSWGAVAVDKKLQEPFGLPSSAFVNVICEGGAVLFWKNFENRVNCHRFSPKGQGFLSFVYDFTKGCEEANFNLDRLGLPPPNTGKPENNHCPVLTVKSIVKPKIDPCNLLPYLFVMKSLGWGSGRN